MDDKAEKRLSDQEDSIAGTVGAGVGFLTGSIGIAIAIAIPATGNLHFSEQGIQAPMYVFACFFACIASAIGSGCISGGLTKMWLFGKRNPFNSNVLRG